MIECSVLTIQVYYTIVYSITLVVLIDNLDDNSVSASLVLDRCDSIKLTNYKCTFNDH